MADSKVNWLEYVLSGF